MSQRCDCCWCLHSGVISPFTTRHFVFLSEPFSREWCSPCGSSKKTVLFPFTPLERLLWSPLIPGGKRCLCYYSKLWADAIFMALSSESARKAVTVRGILTGFLLHRSAALPSPFFFHFEHCWRVISSLLPLPCHGQQLVWSTIKIWSNHSRTLSAMMYFPTFTHSHTVFLPRMANNFIVERVYVG